MIRWLACLPLLLCGVPAAIGQAIYTAHGPGTYVAVGATFSGFDADYGQRKLGGEAIFLDAHLYRRIGVEAEVRQLNLHTNEGVRERTYLVGPKLSALSRRYRPYAKLLAGRGELDFPFGYAHGSYFVVAPAAGIDVRIRQSRVLVRLIDFEYQIWPQFTFGQLHPYGLSTGLSVRVF